MFLSKFEHPIDSKGRVSLPGAFRAALGGEEHVFCWMSFDGPFLEGGGARFLEKLSASIEGFDLYDDARIAFAQAIFGAARQLSLDSTGRLGLPKDFSDHAAIDKTALFVGLGDRFQVWAPDAYAQREREARAFAAANKNKLQVAGAKP